MIAVFSNLFASDSHWEAVILRKILFSITQKKELTVYSGDEHLRMVLHQIEGIRVSEECLKNVDFVLSKDGRDDVCAKPEILFDYERYLKTKNAIGVFFWQKGRPTIRFSKKRLDDFHLKVRGELTKFVSSI